MKRTLTSALLLAVLAACSGGDVTLEIDVLSFLNDAGAGPDPNATYAYPVPPTGIVIQGIDLIDDREFQLLDSIDDVTVVDEGELTYRVEAVNREGAGRATLKIRLAATREGLDDGASILPDIDLPLLPDSTTTAAGTVDLGSLVEIFANDSAWVRIETDLRVDPGDVVGDSLAGTLWLRRLDVRVVADEDFF